MSESILFLIIYFAEGFIAYHYFASVFSLGFDNKRQIGVITLAYLILFLVSRISVPWLNTICFFVINLCCVLYVVGKDLTKALFHTFILTIAMNVTELLVLNLLAYCYKDFTAYTEQFSILLLLAVTSKLLYFLVLQIVIKFFGGEKDEDNDTPKISLLLSCVSFISMWITLALIITGIEGIIPQKVNLVIGIGAVLLLVMNIVVFYIYNYIRKTNRIHLYTELQLQKERADAQYYKALLEHDEKQKIFIHDMKKHLNTISDMLEKYNDATVKDYVKRIIRSEELREEIHFCDNTVLNLILVRYNQMCKENNIDFFIDIRKDTVDFMDIEDITVLFGNILENAVDAAKGVDESYIDLMVKKSEEERLVITMINSCSTRPEQKPDGSFISRKKNAKRHGFGLKSVARVVKKYKGYMNTYYCEDDHTFHNLITI